LTAPLRAAHPVVVPDAAGDEAPTGRSGRFVGALLVGSVAALLGLGAVAWSLAPTLYTRPDGVRAQTADPQPGQLRHDLRRAALRLAEPVTIRRR
jgi:hypothetical protein